MRKILKNSILHMSLPFSVRNARLIEDGQGSVIGKHPVFKKNVKNALRK